jgi:hypothetical protein
MGKKIGGRIAWALAFGIASWAAKYGVSYLRGQELGLTGAGPGRLRRRRDSDLRRQAVQRPGKCKHRKTAAGAILQLLREQHGRSDIGSLRELSGLSDAQKIAEMKPLIDASYRLCLQELEHSLPTAK